MNKSKKSKYNLYQMNQFLNLEKKRMKNMASVIAIFVFVVFGFVFSANQSLAACPSTGTANCGVFTSQVKDIGYKVAFSTLSWSETIPAGTYVTVEVQAGNPTTAGTACSAGVTWDVAWQAVANGGSLAAFNAHQCLQYRTTLSSDDINFAPSLDEVIIGYYYPFGELISTPYNTRNYGNQLTGISWQETKPGVSDVLLQVRTSGTGTGWTSWMGPDGTSSSYFTDPAGGEAMPAGLATGDNDQWIQYKLTLKRDYNDATTPVLSDLTISYNFVPFSGTFISQVKDATRLVAWTTIDWTETLGEPSANASLAMRVRSGDPTGANCAAGVTWSEVGWVSVSNGGSLAAFSGHQCLQYEATFSTYDSSVVPSLSEVNLNYNYYEDNLTLISSPYNTNSSGNVVAQISWKQDADLPVNTALKFQLQSSSDNITWSGWMGPDGTSGSYFYYTSAEDKDSNCVDGGLQDGNTTRIVNCIIPTGHALKIGEDDQWMQYQIFFRTSGASFATLYDMTITYVANSAPCVGASITGPPVICAADTITGIAQTLGAKTINLPLFHISDEEAAAEGGVVNTQFFYDVGIILPSGGSGVENSGNITVSSGASLVFPTSGYVMIDNEVIHYTSIIDGGGANDDILVVPTDPTGRGVWSDVGYTTQNSAHNAASIVWLWSANAVGKGNKTGIDNGTSQTFSADFAPVSDFIESADGTFYYDSAKIRIALNDGNGSTQVGTNTTNSFVLDLKKPIISLVIDSNAESSTLTDIVVTDDSAPYYVRYANATNIDGSTCAVDIASALYESLIGNSKVWSLSPNAAGISTVCFQAKDNYENITEIKVVSTPATPTGIDRSDIAVVFNEDFTLVLWWDQVEFATSYNVWRSLDGVDYGASPYVVIPSGATNFCYDEGDGDCLNNLSQGSLDQYTDYFYKVTAEKSDGISFYSPVVSARPDGSAIGEVPAGDITAPELVIDTTPTASALTTNSTTIIWQTDERSYSLVKYREQGQISFAIAGSIDKNDRAFVTENNTTDFSHSVPIAGLLENTIYEFQVLSADAQGNLMERPENPPTDSYYTFQTASTPPALIGEPSFIAGRDTATIYWQTDEASTSQVNYVQSTENDFMIDPAGNFQTTLQEEKVTEHYVIINANLSSGNFYNYQVIFEDVAGNSVTYPASADYKQFGTSTDPDNIKPTLYSGPTPNGVSSNATTSATIVWNTNERSYSLVKYRIVGEIEFLIAGSVDKDDINFVTEVTPDENYSHTVPLSNLTPDSNYEYQVLSADSAGNLMIMPLSSPPYYTFFTDALSPDTDKPVVSSVTVTPGRTTATVYWVTDEASTSQVNYVESTKNDLTTNPETGFSTAEQTEKVTEHYVILTNLDPGKSYNIQVISTDAAASLNTEIYPASSPFIQFDIAGDQKDQTGPMITVTTLNENLDSSSTDNITLSSNLLLPSAGTIQIGTEHIVYTGIVDNDTDLTGITRGSSPSSHAIGDLVVALTDNFAYLTYISTDEDETPNFFSVEYEAVASGVVTAPASYTKEFASPSAITSGSVGIVILEGLTADTKYFYKLKSRDLVGNTQSLSGDSYYFTTTSDTTPPAAVTDLAVSISSSKETITLSWTSPGDNGSVGTASSYDIQYTTDADIGGTAESFETNWGSVSLVNNEPLPLVAGSSQSITFVNPNETSSSVVYYFAMKTTDESSQTSDISNIKAITVPARADTDPPTITPGSVADELSGTSPETSVIITWDTEEASSSFVNFGTATPLSESTYTATQGDFSNTYTNNAENNEHSVTLVGLTPGTTYYYRVISYDSSGLSASLGSEDASYTFTTASSDAGIQPIITNINPAVGSDSSSYVISWDTVDLEENALTTDAIIAYGLDGSNPTYPLQAGSLVKNSSHAVTLANLTTPNKTYNYQIRSRNGLLVGTYDGTFTTGASEVVDKIPPIFSKNPTVSSITNQTAVISWSTSEASDTYVYYGKETQSHYSFYQESKSNSDQASVLEHSLTLSGLDAETNYYFMAVSADLGANIVSSHEYYFTTTVAPAQECPSCSSGGGLVRDTNPPTISNIVVSEITASTAVVKWETNEAGYSMVKYGEEDKYDKINGSYEESVKTHIVTLINLNSDTLHNYKVASADSSGNLAQSENLTFQTLAKEDLTEEEKKEEKEKQTDAAIDIQNKIQELIEQGMEEEEIRDIIAKATNPPTIAAQGPALTDVTNSSAKITWSTDRKSNSVVRFKTKEEGINPEESSSLKQYGSFTVLVTDHNVILTGLSSGTTYQYQVQSSDILGNTGKSPWQEFTTAIVPSIFDVVVSDVTLNSVIINWKTNVVSSSKVEYGETINYNFNQEDTDKTKVAKHFLKLNNLTSGTTYHYRVRGIDDSGNALVSDDYTFTTFTLPQILTHNVSQVEETRAIIEWKTNVATDSTIKYTNLNDNITKKQGEDALSSIHSFILKSLTPGTKYVVQIQGRDIYANQVISPEFEITTPEDTTPAEITQVRTETAVSSGKSDIVQTIISWKTNEPTTSQILWEEGITNAENPPANLTQEDLNYTTSHITVITNFKPNSLYRFRTAGKDRAGNASQSQDFTILIPEKKKSVIQIITANLENTFGWAKNLGL